ncbi:transposase [Paradevosia shaoguanensis]|uniref:transposase n=1 Tax=Paradevosia shaoguanensis TaxID=1335043 RepID=UPI000A99B1F2|nr:transposase [Paradevosia shaoguanensis]
MTAAVLLAQMPELGRRSGKQIATLAGLAPLNNDSGTRRGQRSIHVAVAASARPSTWPPSPP